ncbi:MAG: hemerythrin domain-containing protein [Hydrogenophaga sp.]|jgi:hemerythrin-like domain-containing protein|uniref:hemerythrin domain-containing protein n=1 Tax=Hydrogenophaga sp. TaxID=1904254 RepID=UPI0026059659|nr:hemerythrin domain-containing protein [Hydrogenophaga sp.]MCW5670657.1 hemerythrin domain-containing protein [Hydrogenophaga sp.]
MNTTQIPDLAAAGDTAPLDGFANCHIGILKRLNVLGELPALIDPAARARRIAADALAFFREAIFEHHLDEENELFPAVLASATPGDERLHVQALVNRLTREHRILEGLWKVLEKDLKRVAKGQDTDLDAEEVSALVAAYASHATLEEEEFLPLCQEILGRNGNHMAALGLSLHLRHAPPITAHI